MIVVLSEFLESSEGFFNRHDVWRIRRQEEEDCSCLCNKFCRALRFVKGCIIHHDHIIRPEHRTEHFFQPLIEYLRIACSREQHGRGQFALHQRSNQTGARAPVARTQPIHLLPAHGPAVLAFSAWRKSALIHVEKAFALCMIAIPALKVATAFIPVP